MAVDPRPRPGPLSDRPLLGHPESLKILPNLRVSSAAAGSRLMSEASEKTAGFHARRRDCLDHWSLEPRVGRGGGGDYSGP